MKKQMVMLYGLCGDVSIFKAQADFFAKDYDVHVIDWFTLCEPAIDNTGNPFEQASSFLINYLETHKIKNPILIGHSMGGGLALDMVARLHYPVDRLIILDASITPSTEQKQSYRQFSNTLLANIDKPDFMENFFREHYFLPCDDLAQQNRLIKSALNRLHPLWFKILATAVESDFTTMLTELVAPTLYIGSSEPKADFSQIKAINSRIQLAQVQHSGHFIMIFAEKQVNALLEQFLKTSGN